MRGVDVKLEFVAIRLEVDFKLQFKLARHVCVDVWQRSGDIGNTTVITSHLSLSGGKTSKRYIFVQRVRM